MDFQKSLLVIEPSKKPELRELTSYDEVRQILGGPMEYYQFENFGVYCNDSAKRQDPMPPLNWVATKLFTEIGGMRFLPGDGIMGPIVVFGRLNEAGRHDGEVHHVPEDVKALIQRLASKR